MKPLILLAIVAAIAACDQPKTAPESTSGEAKTAAEPAAPAQAASWPLEAGTYEYSRSDGRAGVNTVAADGTFSNAVTGGETETGTWANENGQVCLSGGSNGEKRCYTFTQPDAEGNFTGTMANGITMTVRKVA